MALLYTASVTRILVAVGGIALSAIAYAPLTVTASVSGPVPARTGGFNEMTCQQCHWDGPLNDPAGRLDIEGIPAAYTAGKQYMITLRVSHPELMRGGFQLAARFDDGTNAGTLASRDDLAEVVPDDDGRIRYLQHTRKGSQPPSPSRGEWSFTWTAPAEARAVQFHAAANASNGDASPLGDFIYTAAVTSSPLR